MSCTDMPRAIRRISHSRACEKTTALRPLIEPLEGRLMLDAGGSSDGPLLSPAIVERERHLEGSETSSSGNEPMLIASTSALPVRSSRFLARSLGAIPGNARVREARPADPVDTAPPTISLSAPNVKGSNAESLNPYIFSTTYSDDVAVDRTSIRFAVVEVRPPSDTPIDAYPLSITASGPTDSQDDAPRKTATCQVTPPGGSWGTAPAGSYSVILSGMPVTDLAGNPLVTSVAGTFSVRLGGRRLVVLAQPAGLVNVGAPFGLMVALEDRQGSTLTHFHGNLSIALGANPGGATLGGTMTATASGGIAVFSGLTLNQPARDYRLEVSGAGLHITTAPFEATNDLILTFDGPPGPTVALMQVVAKSLSKNYFAHLHLYNGLIPLADRPKQVRPYVKGELPAGSSLL